MPSLSRSLEQALHRAIKLASDRHHEYATLEHLLLALTEEGDADLPPDVQRPSPVEFVIPLKDDGGVRRITLPLTPGAHSQ